MDANFVPATSVAETDIRPGGTSLIIMRGSDGNEFSSRGVHLEVAKNERLVFTDACTKAREPSKKPFMTVVLTFVPGWSAFMQGMGHGRRAEARPPSEPSPSRACKI